MGLKRKAKVKAVVYMTVWLDEDTQGNQEIDDIEEVYEVEEFEVKTMIS